MNPVRSFLFFILAITTFGGSSSFAGTSHSTFRGRIGTEYVAAVLEFREDRSVEGAYVVENEFNLKSGAPFPIRRMRGSNPREGIVELEASLNGAAVGRMTLRRESRTSRMGAPIWSGELVGSKTLLVSWERHTRYSGAALINSVSDAEHQTWMTAPEIRGLLKVLTVNTPFHVDDEGHAEGGWSQIFGDNLMPAISAGTTSCRTDTELGRFKVGKVSEGAVELRFSFARDPDDDEVPPLRADLAKNPHPVVQLRWNRQRDGDFVLEEGQEGTGELDSKLRCVTFTTRDYFIGRQIRLANSNCLELKGDLWSLPNEDEEGGLNRPVKRLSSSPKTIRMAFWSAEDMVSWDIDLGYFITGGGRGGDGGVALESLTQAAGASDFTVHDGTPWLNLRDRTDMNKADADGDGSYSIWLFPDDEVSGIPTAKGLMLFKSRPDFYIPWNKYMRG